MKEIRFTNPQSSHSVAYFLGTYTHLNFSDEDLQNKENLHSNDDLLLDQDGDGKKLHIGRFEGKLVTTNSWGSGKQLRFTADDTSWFIRYYDKEIRKDVGATGSVTVTFDHSFSTTSEIETIEQQDFTETTRQHKVVQEIQNIPTGEVDEEGNPITEPKLVDVDVYRNFTRRVWIDWWKKRTYHYSYATASYSSTGNCGVTNAGGDSQENSRGSWVLRTTYTKHIDIRWTQWEGEEKEYSSDINTEDTVDTGASSNTVSDEYNYINYYIRGKYKNVRFNFHRTSTGKDGDGTRLEFGKTYTWNHSTEYEREYQLQRSGPEKGFVKMIRDREYLKS